MCDMCITGAGGSSIKCYSVLIGNLSPLVQEPAPAHFWEPGAHFWDHGAHIQDPGAHVQDPGAHFWDPGAHFGKPRTMFGFQDAWREPGLHFQDPRSDLLDHVTDCLRINKV